jgi:PadR family transcriptional regulator, regulatory protein AphA
MKNISKTQYALLGALSVQPMSGYEIKKMLAESTNYFWRESNGQIYPTLKKLAKDKFVTIEKQTIGAKIKKIYTLTKTGQQKLCEWLRQDFEYYPPRHELLLKLFYGQNVAPQVSLHHIQKHLQKCEYLLNIYNGIEKKLTLLVKQGKRPVYFLLTVKSGVSAVKAEIAWCKESISLINKFAINS